jgi:hypothetical protein
MTCLNFGYFNFLSVTWFTNTVFSKCKLPFHFVDDILGHAEAFKFDVGLLSHFCICGPSF